MTSSEDIARTQEIEAALDDARPASPRCASSTGPAPARWSSWTRSRPTSTRPGPRMSLADDQLPAVAETEEVTRIRRACPVLERARRSRRPRSATTGSPTRNARRPTSWSDSLGGT